MAGVRDDQLGDPTPCDRFTVAELLEHVGEFAAVFTTNARKEEPVAVEGLPAGLRTSLPRRVRDMAVAWQD